MHELIGSIKLGPNIQMHEPVGSIITQTTTEPYQNKNKKQNKQTKKNNKKGKEGGRVCESRPLFFGTFSFWVLLGEFSAILGPFTPWDENMYYFPDNTSKFLVCLRLVLIGSLSLLLVLV